MALYNSGAILLSCGIWVGRPCEHQYDWYRFAIHGGILIVVRIRKGLLVYLYITGYMLNPQDLSEIKLEKM